MNTEGRKRGWGWLGPVTLAAAIAGCLGPADAGDDEADPSIGTQGALKDGRRGRGERCRGERADTPLALRVPARACLKASARGWGEQVYTCSAGVWVLKAPEADLLDGRGHYLGNHFLGPTWQWRDGSKLRGARLAQVAAPDAQQDLPWLLLSATTRSDDDEGELGGVTHIQRLDTVGGLPPAGPCTAGAEIRVHYAADYRFYRLRQ